MKEFQVRKKVATETSIRLIQISRDGKYLLTKGSPVALRSINGKQLWATTSMGSTVQRVSFGKDGILAYIRPNRSKRGVVRFDENGKQLWAWGTNTTILALHGTDTVIARKGNQIGILNEKDEISRPFINTPQLSNTIHADMSHNEDTPLLLLNTGDNVLKVFGLRSRDQWQITLKDNEGSISAIAAGDEFAIIGTSSGAVICIDLQKQGDRIHQISVQESVVAVAINSLDRRAAVSTANMLRILELSSIGIFFQPVEGDSSEQVPGVVQAFQSNAPKQLFLHPTDTLLLAEQVGNTTSRSGTTASPFGRQNLSRPPSTSLVIYDLAGTLLWQSDTPQIPDPYAPPRPTQPPSGRGFGGGGTVRQPPPPPRNYVPTTQAARVGVLATDNRWQKIESLRKDFLAFVEQAGARKPKEIQAQPFLAIEGFTTDMYYDFDAYLFSPTSTSKLLQLAQDLIGIKPKRVRKVYCIVLDATADHIQQYKAAKNVQLYVMNQRKKTASGMFGLGITAFDNYLMTKKQQSFDPV